MLGKIKSMEHSAAAPASSDRTETTTVIGEHISVEGDIRGSEDLVIEGSVKGSIQLTDCHLTVGPKGQVEGEIHAENATISGRMVGNIKVSGKVQITKEADFSGEIKAKRIAIEDGAMVKAAIEMEREPQRPVRAIGDTAEKAKSRLEREPLSFVTEAEMRK